MEETLESFRISKPEEVQREVTTSQPVEAQSNVNVQQEIPQQPVEDIEEQIKEEIKLQEADLLNLGMPDTSTLNNTVQSTVNPGLDIFSNSSNLTSQKEK